MKNWFSNDFPLLYIYLHCDEGCIFWHFGAPDTPGFYVRAQHDPDLLFYLNSKGFYHIAYIFYMYINIKERVDVNQDGPSLVIEAPPPPRTPNSQRC